MVLLARVPILWSVERKIALTKGLADAPRRAFGLMKSGAEIRRVSPLKHDPIADLNELSAPRLCVAFGANRTSPAAKPGLIGRK